MFKLRCPLLKRFLGNARTCTITQLFGEQKGLPLYGPNGHPGLDIATKREYKYKRDTQKGVLVWRKDTRTQEELEGFIPCLATHDGTLDGNLFLRDKARGWGVYVTSNPTEEDGKTVMYRTLYWHLESPFASLASYEIGKKMEFEVKEVKAGAIIATCGNSGYPLSSSGSHLHFELKKRVLDNGAWGEWFNLDPILYFNDDDVLYQRYYSTLGVDSRWFYKGKEITRKETNEISKSLTKVI